MDTARTIQISVPAELSPTSVELMKATMNAIVALRCDCSKDWNAILNELERDGWQCSWHLNWVAEAKRDLEYERAMGANLDETFESLRQLTHLHLVENCP
ncbi:hypothetical protein HZB60_03320 [candidate division KSB1 bacterium]|nr:hypothetical protein [candidate division KSB1 bacterium]